MEAKRNYYLQIADNAHILSHRLSEYCSYGPFLEEDLANTNVALDLIGLAESIYEELARQENKGETGDDIAYKRPEEKYRNSILAEQPNTDFAYLIVRQFFMDAFHFYFFTELSHSKDSFLQAIADKSIKEVRYHLRRSSEWIVRFGTGTEESKQRTQLAINNLWKYTDAFFIQSEADLAMEREGVAADLKKVKLQFKTKVDEIMYLAHFKLPENGYSVKGGKEGVHSENLGFILCEMQYLPNRYPDAIW